MSHFNIHLHIHRTVYQLPSEIVPDDTVLRCFKMHLYFFVTADVFSFAYVFRFYIFTYDI